MLHLYEAGSSIEKLHARYWATLERHCADRGWGTPTLSQRVEGDQYYVTVVVAGVSFTRNSSIEGRARVRAAKDALIYINNPRNYGSSK